MTSDRHAELPAAFVTAAGDNLAEDARWPSYRRRRLRAEIERGITPLPSKITRAIALHRAADEAERAVGHLSGEHASDDDLDRAEDLMDQARELRREAGPPVALYWPGRKQPIRAGIRH